MQENTDNIQPDNVEVVDQTNEEPSIKDELPAPENREAETPQPEDHSEKSLDELPLPGSESEEDEDDKKLPKWVEKRISKKEREAQQKAAEAEMYKAEAERLRQNVGAQPNFTHEVNAPSRDDYDTEHAYIAAVVRHENEKAAQAYHLETQQKAALEKERNFQKKMQAAADEGSDKYDDFDEKVGVLFKPTFPANRLMAEAIADSEFKADILYFLGTYPEHAEKIARKDPIQAIKEIAKLESRFAEKKKPNITKAPAPLKPLNSNQGKAGYSDKEPDNMDDFKEWYKAKFGKR